MNERLLGSMVHVSNFRWGLGGSKVRGQLGQKVRDLIATKTLGVVARDHHSSYVGGVSK
jgi:hypothetical protein